jgi:hypothetical protein
MVRHRRGSARPEQDVLHSAGCIVAAKGPQGPGTWQVQVYVFICVSEEDVNAYFKIPRQDTDESESALAPGDTMDVDITPEDVDEEEMLADESERRARGTGEGRSGRTTRSSAQGDERARHNSETRQALDRFGADQEARRAKSAEGR